MVKLIYIHYSSLTKRWADYYCLDEMERSFDVEYWDCSHIVHPHFSVDNPIMKPYITVIHNSDHLETLLKELPAMALIILDIHRCEQNYKVLRLISRYKPNVVNLDFFSNTINQPRWKKFVEDYTSLKNIRRKFFSLIFRNMFHVTRVGCGQDEKYRINHPDYEYSLKIVNEPPLLSEGDYFVYIDNNFPYHPEIKYREPYLDIEQVAKGFYASLNAYFDRLEEKYGCKVVIAGHPAAQYKDNHFKNRRIVLNNTGLLVRDCKAVLIHTSNAVSFAFLYNKPVTLLHNASYREARTEFRRLRESSKKLRFPMADTDYDDGENVLKNHIDDEFRTHYIHKYLVDKDDLRGNKEKIIQHLRDIEKTCNHNPNTIWKRFIL